MESSELKRQIEALLFSAGRALTNEEMAKMIGIKSKDAIAEKAKELKKDYQDNDSSILITQESEGWKMTIRERYLSLVREINPYTELSKTVMETLAVVAWKSPVLQSTVIKIRTNKAYDHLGELEELGFIIKEKYGRSYMLKLTQKFFEYFDLKDKKDISKLFKDLKDKEDIEEQLKVDEFDALEGAEEGAKAIAEELSNAQSNDECQEEMSDEEKMVINEISKLEESGDEDTVLEELGEVKEGHNDSDGVFDDNLDNSDTQEAEPTEEQEDVEEAEDELADEVDEDSEEESKEDKK